jgi:hypothetical protein
MSLIQARIDRSQGLEEVPAADRLWPHVEVHARLPQSRTLGTGGLSFPRLMAAEARVFPERLAFSLGGVVRLSAQPEADSLRRG